MRIPASINIIDMLKLTETEEFVLNAFLNESHLFNKTAPARSFSIAELVRLTKMSRMSCHDALISLVHRGLIRPFSDNKKSGFSIRPQQTQSKRRSYALVPLGEIEENFRTMLWRYAGAQRIF